MGSSYAPLNAKIIQEDWASLQKLCTALSPPSVISWCAGTVTDGDPEEHEETSLDRLHSSNAGKEDHASETVSDDNETFRSATEETSFDQNPVAIQQPSEVIP